MKKIIFLCVSVVMMLTSCFKEKDNWYTNTAKYDGRFSVATALAEEYSFVNEVFESWGFPSGHFDDNIDIEEGLELWIFNSAANVEDEIIIDTYVSTNYMDEGPVHIRGKFKITGSPANFTGRGIVTNIAATTEFPASDDGNFFLDLVDEWGYYDEPWYVFDDEYEDTNGLPEGLGEEWNAIQLYTRMSMEEGKITPDGATTIGGNKSDAVSVKLTLYHDLLVIESYETPADTWADPDEAEYAWRIKEGSRKDAVGLEEHWTLTGYRYTGYPEDIPH